MGAFLAENFRSGWKKVGSFTIRETPNGGAIKIGGNVAAYFCTPDLRVIQGIAGNVTPEAFLKEAEFAMELSRKLQNTCFDESQFLAREALRDLPQPRQWRWGGGGEGPLGSFLAEKPLPDIEDVYKLVFEGILREKVSDKDVVRDSRFGPINVQSQIQRKAVRQ